jgi:hypothetical protein
MRRAALAATLAALLGGGAALAGCGSSSSTGTSASPATVTPATAPLYIGAVVRPEGTLQTNATAVGHALTGRAHPYEGVLRLLAGPTGHPPDYAKEVQPWLGPHGGVYLAAGTGFAHAEGLFGEALHQVFAEGFTGIEGALLGSSGLPALLGSGTVQGAVVLDTTSVSAAQTFLEGQAHAAGAHTSSYRGVTYWVAPDGVAEGIVHRFAVIGTVAGFQGVVDTAAGGPSLAQAAGYAKLSSTAEPQALASAYFNVAALRRAGVAGGGSAGAGAAGSAASGSGAGTAGLLPLVGRLLGSPGQVYASLLFPSASSAAFDFDTLPPATGAAASAPSATTGAQVLRGLPGSSWLAIGFGDFGHAIGDAQGMSALTSLTSGLSLGGISLGAAFAPLSSPGLDVQRNLLSWAGPAGIYASGSSLLNLQAALVIASTSPARSRAGFAALEQAYRAAGGQVSPTSVSGAATAVTIKLPSFPLALTMAYGQGRFVVGVGASSVQEALSPSSTLGATPTYTAAASALGQGLQPSAIVEFHTLSGLLEALGLNQAQGVSGFAAAIAPLGTLTIGGGESLADGVRRARVVVSLQSTATSGEASG